MNPLTSTRLCKNIKYTRNLLYYKYMIIKRFYVTQYDIVSVVQLLWLLYKSSFDHFPQLSKIIVCCNLNVVAYIHSQLDCKRTTVGLSSVD